jgi:hypothetical protein
LPPPVIDLADDDDIWQALDEMEGNPYVDKGKGERKEKTEKLNWIPEGMDPVLEELPKWNLLSEILQEAEEEMIRQESLRKPITAGSLHCHKQHDSISDVSISESRKQHRPRHGIFDTDLQRPQRIFIDNGSECP